MFPPETRPMRILLVEDDAMIGDALRKALLGAGMSVDWVRNGGDAKVALTESAYSLVLLDLGLPGAEGFDLLKTARGRDGDAGIDHNGTRRVR